MIGRAVGRSKLRHWLVVALAMAVAAAALLSYLAGTSSGQPAPATVDFTMSHHLPVAGRTFTGLTIINLNHSSVVAPFGGVRCDAQVGGKRLAARQNLFYTPPHRYIQAVACGWAIPADAAGKRLRLWDYGGTYVNDRAWVDSSDGRQASPEFSWVVQKP